MNKKKYKLEVPRGFGTIVNTSKDDPYLPWLAKKVASYDLHDDPVYEDIGYFETFPEALLALVINDSFIKHGNNLSESLLQKKIDELYLRTERKVLEKTYPYLDKPLHITCGDKDYHNSKIIYTPILSPTATVASLPDNVNLNNFTNNGFNPALDYHNPLMRLTFKEVYERWLKDKQCEEITKSTIENYKNAFKKVSYLNDRIFVELRFSEIEDVVKHEKDIGNSYAMRKKMKLFFSQLYQWAISHEMCTTNMALNIKLGKNESESRRKPFTLKQVSKLFDCAEEHSFIETVLMLIYTGCRISEFLNIRREDIHMDQRYFIVTESKTKAGRNRMIPISHKIMRFFRKRLRAKSDWLIHDKRGRKISYAEYTHKFKKCMDRFGWDGYSVHCTRHTCATMLHSAGADEQTTKRILGHVQGATVTERTYIHVQLEDLYKAIDLI